LPPIARVLVPGLHAPSAFTGAFTEAFTRAFCANPFRISLVMVKGGW